MKYGVSKSTPSIPQAGIAVIDGLSAAVSPKNVVLYPHLTKPAKPKTLVNLNIVFKRIFVDICFYYLFIYKNSCFLIYYCF